MCGHKATMGWLIELIIVATSTELYNRKDTASDRVTFPTYMVGVAYSLASVWLCIRICEAAVIVTWAWLSLGNFIVNVHHYHHELFKGDAILNIIKKKTLCWHRDHAIIAWSHVHSTKIAWSFSLSSKCPYAHFHQRHVWNNKKYVMNENCIK